MARIEVMDGRDVLSDLAELGGDALLVIGTEACGACRRARQVLSGLSEAQLGGPGLRVVDVDALHAMGLVRDWEIEHLPGLILVRDGEGWARVMARLEPDALAAAVRGARLGPSDPEL